MKWFAVHTLTGQENKVQRSIERLAKTAGLSRSIGRVLVPTEEEIKMSGGKKRRIKRKVFPGYILVQAELDDATWHFIRNTAGVTGFVGSGRRPVPLVDGEVQAILRRIGEGGKPRIAYTEGETVRIIHGPFEQQAGKVEEVFPQREKLRVLVSVFGRETPVELDFAHVEKL